jgi:HPt (histidine-containing phosphotransfer) domain-containing protein
MHHALASGDAVGLWNAAHTFKSCCAILGALHLSEMCRQIESMGRENALDGAEELLTAIDREYGAACATLEALLPRFQVLP